MAKKEEPGFMFFQEERFDRLTNLIQGAKPVYKVPEPVDRLRGERLCLFLHSFAFAIVTDIYRIIFTELEEFYILHAFANLLFDFVAEVSVVLEEQARIFATLADAFVVVAEPGAALLDDIQFAGEVENRGFARNAHAVENVEFALGKRSGDLVLNDLYAGAVTDDFFAVLDGGDTADVDTLGGVELQGVTTGSRFRVTEHHANLHTELVDEQHAGV